MTLAQQLLQDLIKQDGTRLLPQIHSYLVEAGFQGKQQNKTLLYCKDGMGRVALRVDNGKSIFSFFKHYWEKYPSVLALILNAVPPEYNVPLTGNRVRYSAGQIEIHADTDFYLKQIIANVIGEEPANFRRRFEEIGWG